MKAALPSPRGGRLLGLLRWRPGLAAGGMVALFLWCVAQFHRPDTGFTSLIMIGDALNDSKVAALRDVPHHVYEGSFGYDGSYYVQLALHPTLDNPELTKAIDNLPYRARRMLVSWAAWVCGLGRPAWVVQAYALINVACWLVLAWALLRWFPMDSWENFARWAAVMFSHGLCMSVRHSLADGPSLLLVALAMRWLESGRRVAGGATLALAGLGKETSLLACAGLDFDWKAPRTWWRPAVMTGLVALPALAWLAYVRLRFGPAEDPGMGNFTWPLAGLAEKLTVSVREALGSESTSLAWATVLASVALGVQGMFFALHRRPEDRWWRVGAAFALMMAFLSTPVWEGYPGAASRVLLPMTLAFNILVPRGRRWLAVVIAGNLTVIAAYHEFSPPERDFFQVTGTGSAVAMVRVEPASDWYGPESFKGDNWRWSSGQSELRIQNSAGRPLMVAVRGHAAAVDARTLRIFAGEAMVWSGELGRKKAEFGFGCMVPVGGAVLRFVSDKGGQPVGTDLRKMSFNIFNLEIAVKPAGGSR